MKVTGIAIVKDGTYGQGLIWNVYAIDEQGNKTLLSPTRVLEVKEPRVVDVLRENKQTRKMQKEKRHLDVVVGTRTVTGERQDAAMVRAMAELKKQILEQNKIKTAVTA